MAEATAKTTSKQAREAIRVTTAEAALGPLAGALVATRSVAGIALLAGMLLGSLAGGRVAEHKLWRVERSS